MEEQNKNATQTPDQLSDILLVLDKDKRKIQAVKNINEKGEMETVEPDKKNQGAFMKVDKHGDLFSNFFFNFLRQLKDPTRFSFFKIPAPVVFDPEMQKHIKKPTKEGEQALSQYELKTETKQKQQKEQNNQPKNKSRMETTQATPAGAEYRYKPEQIDWETMNNLGLSKERLIEKKLLEPMLKGFKTNELVPVSLNLGTVIVRSEARLSLQPGSNGRATVAVHCVRREPELNKPFFGHKFTKEDIENLQRTGNMGRVVDLTNPKTGEIIPSIVSIDRLTNELVAFRADRMKAPDEIKGAQLDEKQKQAILEGKEVHVTGMISKSGKSFDSPLQYNADKGSIEFLFDRSNSNKQTQRNGEVPQAPRIVRGKELSEEQYQTFKEGISIFVPDLVSKGGKEYKGYFKYNKETGDVAFSFNDPDKLREKMQSAEGNKTRKAAESEGKTDKATKNTKEPLNPEQKESESKKQQREQKQKPAKSSGRRR